MHVLHVSVPFYVCACACARVVVAVAVNVGVVVGVVITRGCVQGMSAMKAMRQVMEAEASISRLQSEVSERVVDLGFTLQEEVVDEKVPFNTHTHTHTHTHTYIPAPQTIAAPQRPSALVCVCVYVCSGLV